MTFTELALRCSAEEGQKVLEQAVNYYGDQLLEIINRTDWRDRPFLIAAWKLTGAVLQRETGEQGTWISDRILTGMEAVTMSCPAPEAQDPHAERFLH